MPDKPPEDSRHGVGSLIWRKMRERRPQHRVSVFLMLAMTVVLFLGVQMLQVRDDPKQLAWFLSLYFIFFMVVIGRAIFEMFDIVREHVREREAVFRSTFSEGEFTSELGRRVSQADPGSWPE